MRQRTVTQAAESAHGSYIPSVTQLSRMIVMLMRSNQLNEQELRLRDPTKFRTDNKTRCEAAYAVKGGSRPSNGDIMGPLINQMKIINKRLVY